MVFTVFTVFTMFTIFTLSRYSRNENVNMNKSYERRLSPTRAVISSERQRRRNLLNICKLPHRTTAPFNLRRYLACARYDGYYWAMYYQWQVGKTVMCMSCYVHLFMFICSIAWTSWTRENREHVNTWTREQKCFVVTSSQWRRWVAPPGIERGLNRIIGLCIFYKLYYET